MTAQVPERLIDGGAVVKMVTCMSWPRSHPGIVASVHAPVGILHSTACGRGYQGTWEIRNGRLWLKTLKGCWTLASASPIHTEWITGVLHVWHGKVLDYAHMGFATLYERDELIGIRQGIVVGRTILDNRDDPPLNPEVHYARLRAAMPHGLTRFADEDPAE